MNTPSTLVASAGISSLWDDEHTASMAEPELLLYRSNLLGSDLRITNFGGGNTSAKIDMPDPLTGQSTTVLWVKGSGGDVGSMKLDGFATLYMDKLQALKSRYSGLVHEDAMVAMIGHCTFDLNPRPASIDTALHAYIPKVHVDHMHPDAVIAVAASQNGERLTHDIFEGELAWVPWQRPGFDLGVKLGEMTRAHPHLKGLVLQNHGLFTWGDTSKACYENTVSVIAQANIWLSKHRNAPAFGGEVRAALDRAARLSVVERIAPVLRGKISSPATGGQRKLGHFDDRAEILEFVCSKDLALLAALGTSCPDHFLRTKIYPLVLAFEPEKDNLDEVLASLDVALEQYRNDYQAYYERCKRPNSPAMRDSNAVIYLIPGVGMLSFACDKTSARIASEFYINAINVMREARRVDHYVALPEQEAFDIEYWLLEEAKLQRMPKPKSLAGRIALVTGAAGGIGCATAERLLHEGACVLLADIDANALAETEAGLRHRFGTDSVASAVADVTSEAAVKALITTALTCFGGLDLVVSNAGIASAATVEDTNLALWNRTMNILATGYFLVARAVYKVLRVQGIGGSIVFVASKNGLVASAGAAAYCTAKAAEIHLARCLALEGAEHGIRVNVVNPDAVIRGSKIWDSKWKEARAAANQVAIDDIEDFYRQRSMLKLSVLPEDVAESVYFFASDMSAKSTGNILNVDAGNVAAFTR